MPYPELVRTPRLRLRRIHDEDAQLVETIWSDPHVWRALRPGQPFDRDHGLLRLAHHAHHWREHGFGLWLVEFPPGGEVIGWIGAAHPTFIPRLAAEVEIGWTLRRAWWGQGLASEGAAAAVEAAFKHLAVPLVISLIDRGNSRSAAVAERLGMRHADDVHHPGIGEEVRVYELRRPPS
jgi:RimJ/RimL family protein N-acetyltransferase